MIIYPDGGAYAGNVDQGESLDLSNLTDAEIEELIRQNDDDAGETLEIPHGQM
jgi:hypothetical protein